MLTYAQRYRPFSWDDIVGQDRIVKEMKKRSKDLTYSQIMIFEGPSGTGKTTMAFILGALINDPEPIVMDDGSKRPNPNSSIAKTILNETFSQSVQFFDASRMSKEDVKQLEVIASQKPLYSNQKKVLIIDEAQELSSAGKGVILKLLEKKREDVYFILCTMNINKFDKAVRDRGTVYKFKSVNSQVLAENLYKILKKLPEKDTVPDEFITEGLFAIADGSEGSVRRSIQLFERCLEGEIYSEKDIIEELDIVTNKVISDVVNQLFIKKDPKGILLLDSLDFEQFYYMSRKAFLNAFIYKSTGEVDKKYEWQIPMFKKMVDLPHKKILDTYVMAMGMNFKPNEDLLKIGLLDIVNSFKEPIQTRAPSRTRVPV